MTLHLRIRHQRPSFALDVALQLPASGVRLSSGVASMKASSTISQPPRFLSCRAASSTVS